MAANTSPIFGATINTFGVTIPTSAILTGSNAQGAVVGTNLFPAFTCGANGSFVQKIRFMPAASAPLSTVGSVLRIHLSFSGSGTLTTASAFLLGEMSVPIIASSNASNAANFYEYPLNLPIFQSGSYH